MTRRSRDWATESARRIVQLTTGLSAEVSTTYIASELRMAHQRGGIEAQKNGAAKVPAKAKDGLL